MPMLKPLSYAVLVGRLPYDITDDDLLVVFETYGDVTGVKLEADGRAVISYTNKDSAEDAIEVLHEKYKIKVDAELPITVEFADAGRESEQEFSPRIEDDQGEYQSHDVNMEDDKVEGDRGDDQDDQNHQRCEDDQDDEHKLDEQLSEFGTGTKLFVGNLPGDIKEEELKIVFMTYGKINCIRIMPPRAQSHRRAALVFYDEREAAEDAIEVLDNQYKIRHDMEDTLVVKFAVDKEAKESKDASHDPAQASWSSTGYKVFVGCLPSDVTEEEIMQVFSTYGQVNRAVITNRNGAGQNAALVFYEEKEDAEDAISLLHRQYKIREDAEEPIVAMWGREKNNDARGDSGMPNGKVKQETNLQSQSWNDPSLSSSSQGWKNDKRTRSDDKGNLKDDKESERTRAWEDSKGRGKSRDDHARGKDYRAWDRDDYKERGQSRDDSARGKDYRARDDDKGRAQSRDDNARGKDHSWENSKSRSWDDSSGKKSWKDESSSGNNSWKDESSSGNKNWKDESARGNKSWKDESSSGNNSWKDESSSANKNWKDESARGTKSWKDESSSGNKSWKDESSSGNKSWKDENSRGTKSWKDESSSGNKSWKDESSCGNKSWKDESSSGNKSWKDESSRGNNSWKDDSSSGSKGWKDESSSGNKSWKDESSSGNKSWKDESSSGNNSWKDDSWSRRAESKGKDHSWDESKSKTHGVDLRGQGQDRRSGESSKRKSWEDDRGRGQGTDDKEKGGSHSWENAAGRDRDDDTKRSWKDDGRNRRENDTSRGRTWDEAQCPWKSKDAKGKGWEKDGDRHRRDEERSRGKKRDSEWNERDSVHKLYVSNLPEDISEYALEYVFKNYGRVQSVKLNSGKSVKGKITAFVEYNNLDDAETAIASLHDTYEIRRGFGVIRVGHAGDRRSQPY